MMCELCELKGLDYVILNGAASKLYRATIYGQFRHPTHVNLCRLHDIELFQKGEKTFLETHLELKFKLTETTKDTTTSNWGW